MIYECHVCKLEYLDEDTAKRCQEWCENHNSCNFLIAKQAINKEEMLKQSVTDERFKTLDETK
ncbi:MAG: hypothetical protein HY397_00525 [Candidatus Doudnabacteria bacterium]|nr:hypothetical protein [Candidatus Doudnabacteria bacterium]